MTKLEKILTKKIRCNRFCFISVGARTVWKFLVSKKNFGQYKKLPLDKFVRKKDIAVIVVCSNFFSITRFRWFWCFFRIISVYQCFFNWLYVLIMSRTRFRVNPQSIVVWMSRNFLHKTRAIFEVKVSATELESSTNSNPQPPQFVCKGMLEFHFMFLSCHEYISEWRLYSNVNVKNSLRYSQIPHTDKYSQHSSII